jgi:hypothetical protein
MNEAEVIAQLETAPVTLETAMRIRSKGVPNLGGSGVLVLLLPEL